jgi:RimJ/RimL family protein N-acetyltransferase
MCVSSHSLIARDAKALFEASNGSALALGEKSCAAYDAEELIWRYMFDGPFASLSAFEESLIPYVTAPNGLCFCVFDDGSGRQVGIANYMNNDPAHLKIEVGGIWYSPIAQRTSANTDRRLEWKCDALNARSCRAALRMGFVFEGIQQNHMIMKERSRDTAWYRLLDIEWPQAKERFQTLL